MPKGYLQSQDDFEVTKVLLKISFEGRVERFERCLNAPESARCRATT
jgi:hypothetical protein